MNLETMNYERDGYVGRLTLNRPHILNAVNYQGVLELKKTAQEVCDDPALRIVLIRGDSASVCAAESLRQE